MAGATQIFIYILMGIGGAGAVAYLIWLRTRPMKEVWKANVYQIGEGIIPPQKDKHGNVTTDIKLRDLKTYRKDIIERSEKAQGIVIYRLVDLNKTVPAITSDCVDVWGNGEREVNVLIHNEVCTLLKKGFDENGKLIFNPLPYDTINMIQNEITIRKDRLKQEEKDLWASLTPIMTFAIAGFVIIAMAWLNGQGMAEADKTLQIVSENTAAAQIKSAEILAEAMSQYGTVQQVSQNLGSATNTVITASSG